MVEAEMGWGEEVPRSALRRSQLLLAVSAFHLTTPHTLSHQDSAVPCPHSASFQPCLCKLFRSQHPA